MLRPMSAVKHTDSRVAAAAAAGMKLSNARIVTYVLSRFFDPKVGPNFSFRVSVCPRRFRDSGTGGGSHLISSHVRIRLTDEGLRFLHWTRPYFYQFSQSPAPCGARGLETHTRMPYTRHARRGATSRALELDTTTHTHMAQDHNHPTANPQPSPPTQALLALGHRPPMLPANNACARGAALFNQRPNKECFDPASQNV